MPTTRPAIDRFLEKIVFSDDTECILWGASLDDKGYGFFQAGSRRSIRAHKWLWEYVNGPVPESLELDHVRSRGCVHRHCVNLAHLEPVTHRENVLRGNAPAAINARKTRCIRGHQLAGDNLKRGPRGSRGCLTCARASKAAYKRRNRISQPVEFCQAPDCVNRIPEGTRSSRRYCCDACRIRTWKALERELIGGAS